MHIFYRHFFMKLVSIFSFPKEISVSLSYKENSILGCGFWFLSSVRISVVASKIFCCNIWKLFKSLLKHKKTKKIISKKTQRNNIQKLRLNCKLYKKMWIIQKWNDKNQNIPSVHSTSSRGHIMNRGDIFACDKLKKIQNPQLSLNTNSKEVLLGVGDSCGFWIYLVYHKLKHSYSWSDCLTTRSLRRMIFFIFIVSFL